MRQFTRLALAAALLGLFVPAMSRAQEDGSNPPGENAPPTPQQVVERCVGMVHEATDKGIEGMGAAVERTGAVIAKLDANGATEQAIRRAAQAGKRRVHEMAHRSAGRVQTVSQDCLRLLRRLEAPPAAALAIVEVRERALGALRAAAEHATMQISEFAEQAASGGGAPAAID